MHATRKSLISAAAAFVFLLLLMLCLIPGLKVSAATKPYSLTYTGGTINYSNSNVTTLTSSPYVTITCSNKGSFKISVSANNSSNTRYITLYAKNSKGTVDTLNITQTGIPTKELSIGCAGGNLYYSNSNVIKLSSNSNVTITSSNPGSFNLSVKANNSATTRYIILNCMNSKGNTVETIVITQTGITSKSYSFDCTGGTIKYGNPNVTKFQSNSNASFSSSNPGSYIITINPNTTAVSRSFTLYALSSNGATVEALVISQTGVPSTSVSTVDCTGGTRTIPYDHDFTCSFDSFSSGSSNDWVTRDGSNFVIKPNTSTSARSCRAVLRNGSKQIVCYVSISQKGIAYKSMATDLNEHTFLYGCEAADPNRIVVSDSSVCSCVQYAGSIYYIKVYKNPSYSNRSCDIKFYDKSGKLVAQYTVTQSYNPTKEEAIKRINDKGFLYTSTQQAAIDFIYAHNKEAIDGNTELGALIIKTTDSETGETRYMLDELVQGYRDGNGGETDFSERLQVYSDDVVAAYVHCHGPATIEENLYFSLSSDSGASDIGLALKHECIAYLGAADGSIWEFDQNKDEFTPWSYKDSAYIYYQKQTGRVINTGAPH